MCGFLLVEMPKKFSYLFLFALLTGCAHYHIPPLTEFHPAYIDTPTSQIHLSPILEIDSTSLPYKEDGC